MNTLKRLVSVGAVLSSFLGSARPANADYLLVDAAGRLSPFTVIDQAMALAAPGDTILVLPGEYPAFFFYKGVEVRGLGLEPSAVVVDRVDYHVGIPNLNHHSVLSNLRVCGEGWANDLAITGNELPRGVLWMDRVETCAGVFLHGDPDFYMFMSGCRIEPEAGRGFLGAAMDFGGSQLDIWDSTLVGWNATSAFPAASALMQSLGSRVRIADSVLRGGDGSEAQPFGAGGDAVTTLPSTWNQLTVVGGTVLRGGQGQGAAGGDAVQGIAELRTGNVVLQPGAGQPQGQAFAACSPVSIGFDPALDLVQLSGGPSAPACERWIPRLSSTMPSSAIVIHWDELQVPAVGSWLPLERWRVRSVGPFGWTPCPNPERFPVQFLQAIYWDANLGSFQSSNPVVARNVH